MRKMLNAVFYLLRSGCQWRMLPREFPPWATVHHYFRLWRIGDTLASHHLKNLEVTIAPGLEDRGITFVFREHIIRALTITPPVGPADVEVHEDPGHRELRKSVDPGQVYRPDDVHVQHRGERRQERQPEVEDKEKDRRRYDECFSLLRQLPERRRPLDRLLRLSLSSPRRLLVRLFRTAGQRR
jgi:Putative transposase of IS4/5 family (DUF4096)